LVVSTATRPRRHLLPSLLPTFRPPGIPLFRLTLRLNVLFWSSLCSGVDEKGKPWKPTWEPKTNCTNALIKEWKRSLTEIKTKKKEAKKVRKDQASTSGGSAAGRKRKRSEHRLP